MGICPAQEFERNLVGMLRRRRLVPSRPSAIIRLSPSARSPHEISSGVSRACKHTQARSQQARGCWKEGWPGGCRAYRMHSRAFRPRALALDRGSPRAPDRRLRRDRALPPSLCPIVLSPEPLHDPAVVQEGPTHGDRLLSI